MSFLRPLLFLLKEEGSVLVGGQAVIEGVLMRLPQSYAVAVRNPKGEIKIFKEKMDENPKGFLNKIPFIRGNIILFRSLFLGIKALNFSANIALEEENKKKEDSPFLMGITLFISFLIALLIFFYLPLLGTQIISKHFHIGNNSLSFNLIDGILRIFVFIFYLMLISMMKDIKRVFAYHGAEHKVVHTFEQKEELTIENAQKHKRWHPRCGTSFLLFVMLISILFFSLVPHSYSFIIKALSRIVFLPLIAGTSYELIRLTAKFPKNIFIKPVLYPGILLQYFFTTREPDSSMLEVAIIALKEAQLVAEET